MFTDACQSRNKCYYINVKIVHYLFIESISEREMGRNHLEIVLNTKDLIVNYTFELVFYRIYIV